MMTRNGDHCCVTFKSSKAVDARGQNAKYGAIAIVTVTAMVLIIILTVLASNKKQRQGFDLN
jgi:hypothetical protein